MSVKVMSWVFDHSESRGNERLVLLAIADHADDETWDCWPSIARLAKKAKVSTRTVQRAIRSLADLGELSITEGGGGRRSHRYQIHRYPQRRQGDTSTESGVTADPGGMTLRAARGDTAVTRTTNNHHIEPRICTDLGCPDCYGTGQRHDGFAHWVDVA